MQEPLDLKRNFFTNFSFKTSMRGTFDELCSSLLELMFDKNQFGLFIFNFFFNLNRKVWHSKTKIIY